MPDSPNRPPAGLPGQGRRSRGQHVAHQHGRLYKSLRVVGVMVLALVLVGVGGAGYAFYRLQGNINEIDLTDRLNPDRPADEAAVDPTTGNDAVNILVMGSDTRDLADGTGDEYGGEADSPGARSDTTVIVHLSADRRRAALISIPRDSMVRMPECQGTDGTTQPAELGMFNSAFSRGGPACTINTVEELTKVRIDHYVVVDFSGFQKMIDALGGVDICLPKKVADAQSGLYLDAGTHEVDGRTALAYARIRHNIGDGSDISRISRQQALMSSIVQKVTSSSMLTRPDQLYSFLSAATSSVTMDPQLASLSELTDIAQSLQKLPPGGVQFITVPIEEYPQNKARVQWTSAADDLWQELRTDTLGATAAPAPTTTPGDSSALTVAPDDVSVRVLNTGAPAGTAGAAATALRAQGFTIAGTGDGDALRPAAAAVVRYGSAKADSAATVAAALGGADLVEDDSLGSTVVVELNQAPTVVDVRSRVVGAPATPTATPTFEARVASDDICS
ncbi:LCP family protein [Kineococcus gynurae]|uniref:LCP family protein n=1 Tax=Kineococcus gynurae TaxID=452979 RepID=A0ABV5LT00_9ACTN